MNDRVHISLNNRIVAAEEAYRFSGVLVMSETVCCLCCHYGTGGNWFCK